MSKILKSWIFGFLFDFCWITGLDWNFQVLMHSQNLNEAQKWNFFTAEVFEMSQK
jgi:hypothetical protein